MARKQLKDSAGVNFYPYTDLDAVVDGNENTLSNILDDKQDGPIELSSTYPNMIQAISDATESEPVTLTGDALTEWNNLVSAYSSNGTFTFADSPLAIDRELWTNTNQMQFNTYHFGSAHNTLVFSFHKSGNDFWMTSGEYSWQEALVSGTSIKTINNESILGSGNITISGGGGTFTETDPVFSASAAAGITSSDITNWDNKQSALTFDNTPTVNSNNPVKSGGVYTAFETYNPIIEDTRTSAGIAITGVAPFAVLNDKQRIILHSKYINTGAGAYTLNLTLSDGATTTGAKNIKYISLTNTWNNAYGNYIQNGVYLQLTYDATKDAWLMENDRDHDYATMTQSEIDAGTATSVRVISPTMLRSNFYTEGEVDTLLSGKQDTLTSGTDIKTINSNSIMGSGDLSVGTITSVKMNGTTVSSSGEADLGTVITSETSLSKGNTTGSGNAVTDITVSGHQITLTKGTTFLTEHQSLTSLADGIYYDSTNKRIYLRHGNSNLSGTYAYIDATDFIKDGMVDNVVVGNGSGANAGVTCLIITFNTFDGTPTHQTIELPISQVFNASNYYTKTDIDNAGYLTSETQLSKGNTTGSGNAVTDISVSGHQITLTKGSTFLTSHQSIKTINNTSLVGTGNVTINELPTVTSSDNGKVLRVVNGQWTLILPTTLYSGSATPSNSIGDNGDLYVQI